MNKLLPTIFVIMFVLTGCSIETIFDGGAFIWIVSFLFLVVIAWVIGGSYD